MGKQLHVFLTDEEAQMLEELGDNHSRIIKDAIRSLHANGHSSPRHDGELRITQEQLKEWIEKMRAEEQRKRQDEKDMMPFNQASENAKRMANGMWKK